MNFTTKPLSTLELYADALMHPLMVYLLDAPDESPQRTHKWNYRAFTEDELEYLPDALKRTLSVKVLGDPDACPSHWYGVPRLHLTRFGGWKRYVVLEPLEPCEWYIGWWNDGGAGLSRLPNIGMVRMLVGQSDTIFFGVTKDGIQIPLRQRALGRIGDGGPYRLVPLA